MTVPKPRWFSRPGSILKPYDRFLYQALTDEISDDLERTLDRSRTFSHIPTNQAESVFLPNHQSWETFQRKVSIICEANEFVLRADISNYFERIPQHHLINLMRSAGCSSSVMNLLEEMLLAFQERNSFGIIQGVFPSDLLGNFFLSDFDAYCELIDVASARYVDDIYMGFDSESEARNGLAALIERLRKDGLHLNEYKTSILRSSELEREETTIDRLFDQVRTEIEDTQFYEMSGRYGFDADWNEDEDEDEEFEPINLDIATVERLLSNIGDHQTHADQIEKFCLPILRLTNTDSAVDFVIGRLQEKPQQTRLYFSYLSAFVRTSPDLVASLEDLMTEDLHLTDYQKMYLLAALLKSDRIERSTVNKALNWLRSREIAQETRAMAAVFAARNGTAPQRREVRTMYEGEPSEYVRAAILYSARHFNPVERQTCKRAWGGHNSINALISQAF